MRRFLIITSTLIILGIVYWKCFYVTTYNGIDISYHNVVEWEKLDPNVSFCYIKATEGAHFKDPKCFRHFKEAHEHNLNIGLYHYFRTGVSASEQFKSFKQVYDRFESTLIPMIDVESMGNDFSNIESLNEQLSELIELFYVNFGKYPIIYVGTPKIIPAVYKCPIWIRSLKYSNYVPNFTIKQTAVKKVGSNDIDFNYCSDISKLMLK